jgi:hypothetical protein
MVDGTSLSLSLSFDDANDASGDPKKGGGLRLGQLRLVAFSPNRALPAQLDTMNKSGTCNLLYYNADELVYRLA